MSEKKFQYIIVDFESKPFYYTKMPSPSILMTKTEAYDLNKMLTLNGESKRYVEVWKHYIIPKIAITEGNISLDIEPFRCNFSGLC